MSIILENPVTLIAAVLGFFFLVVAMFKDFSRRYKSSSTIPGIQESEESEEVKLSDPFQSQEPERGNSQKTVPSEDVPASEQSAFKQFVPTDASIVASGQVVDDSDYQWD